MAGLVPAIHVFKFVEAGKGPGITIHLDGGQAEDPAP
jgi:hypothetical protein